MKLTKDQETKLTSLAFAEKSNKEIAEALGIELKEVHAARSRLGITIPKIKAAKCVQPVSDQKVKRAEKEVREEILKVERAHQQAVKKTERCEVRLGELYKELLEAQHGNGEL